MKPALLFAFILFKSSVGDCFCGQEQSGEGLKIIEERSTLADLVSFVDMSINRLNAFKLKLNDGTVITGSRITSMNFSGEDPIFTVDLYMRFVDVIPMKISFERKKENHKYKFKVTFTEMLSNYMKEKAYTQTFTLELEEKTGLLTELCHYFYISLNSIFIKNYSVDLDEQLAEFAKDMEEPLSCRKFKMNYQFFLRKSLIVSLIKFVQENPRIIDEDFSALKLDKHEEEQLEKEIEHVIEVMDVHLAEEVGQETAKIERKKNSVIEKIALNSSNSGNKLKKTQSLHEEPLPFTTLEKTESRPLEMIVAETELNLPDATGSTKKIFLRSKSLYIEPEKQSTYTVLDASDEKQPSDSSSLEPSELNKEIMEEEAEFFTDKEVFNCDYYEGSNSNFFIGLFDVAISPAILNRENKDKNKVVRDTFSPPKLRRTKSATDVIYDALDDELNSRVKIIFDSQVQRDIAESLKNQQVVVRKVNSFNENSPINPHQRNEIQKWLIKCTELLKSRYPDIHIIIYSDYSMYFEVEGKENTEIVKELRADLKLATEREGRVCVEQNGDIQTMYLETEEGKIPMYKLKLSIDGIKELRKRYSSSLKR